MRIYGTVVSAEPLLPFTGTGVPCAAFVCSPRMNKNSGQPRITFTGTGKTCSAGDGV